MPLASDGCVGGRTQHPSCQHPSPGSHRRSRLPPASLPPVRCPSVGECVFSGHPLLLRVSVRCVCCLCLALRPVCFRQKGSWACGFLVSVRGLVYGVNGPVRRLLMAGIRHSAMARSYAHENTPSHQHRAVKRVSAGVVVGRVITCEFPVTCCLVAAFDTWTRRCAPLRRGRARGTPTPGRGCQMLGR